MYACTHTHKHTHTHVCTYERNWILKTGWTEGQTVTLSLCSVRFCSWSLVLVDLSIQNSTPNARMS